MTEFTLPPGDPATLRSAAGAFGGYATEHARQLDSFRTAVTTALAGWHGAAAEQYATAAGEVCGRFAGAGETLKAGQAALNRYASALEDAQQETGRLNAVFAALPPPVEPGYQVDAPGAAAVRAQAEEAASTLRAAQHACAQALEQARHTLAMSCSGELSAPHLLALVKKIAGQLSDPAARSTLEHGLAGWPPHAHTALRTPLQHAAAGHAASAPAGHEAAPARGWRAAPRPASAVPVPAAAVTAAAHWVLGTGPGHQQPGIPPGQPHKGGNMWNAPEEFAHALRSAADPVDW